MHSPMGLAGPMGLGKPVGPSPARRLFRALLASAAVIPFAAAAQLAAVLAALQPATAQSLPPTPQPMPGLRATTLAEEMPRAAIVRAFLPLDADRCVLAIGSRVELFANGANPRLLRDLRSEDVATLCAGPAPGSVYVSARRSGTVHVLDTTSGGVPSTFAGPANAFSACALPGGQLLLQANPNWPQAGANSGVWLAGPGLVPREILSLQGPSGPLLLDHQGNLLVAELGPIVPPPPLAARLLRIPAAKVQLALAGATLSVADATQSGSGFLGIYALAEDDLGCVYTTDPASSLVLRSAPGGLSPIGTVLDAGASMIALGLHFAAGTGAPFAAYQPPERAPSLFVARTDFWSHFEVLQLRPERPQLTLAPALVLAPGPATVTIDGAPAGGFALLAATLAPPIAELPAAMLGTTPLWLALPQNAPLAVQLLPLDATGAALWPFTNPGGYAVTLSFQAIVLGTTGSTTAGTTPLRSLQLLP